MPVQDSPGWEIARPEILAVPTPAAKELPLHNNRKLSHSMLGDSQGLMVDALTSRLLYHEMISRDNLGIESHCVLP